MTTYSAQNLRTYKKNGAEWYKFYSADREGLREMIITVTTYPSPLQQAPSMYSRKSVFDKVSVTTKQYYESVGIKSTISGPEGIGATGGELTSQLLQWVLDHKDILKFIPSIFALSRLLYDKYRSYKVDKKTASLRKKRFQVSLSLALYINNHDKTSDIVGYSQQLLAGLESLQVRLNQAIPQADIHFNCYVYDVNSNKKAAFYIEEAEPHQVTSIISKLGKLSPSIESVSVSLRKRIIGTKIILSKEIAKS